MQERIRKPKDERTRIPEINVLKNRSFRTTNMPIQPKYLSRAQALVFQEGSN